MFSKFSGWLLSGAALFVLVGVVVGQETRSSSPWPFDRSWFGGNGGQNGGNATDPSGQSPNSDSQTLHSVAVPSGITSPYAKNAAAMKRPTQYTAMPNPFTPAAATGANAPTLAPPQAAAAPQVAKQDPPVATPAEQPSQPQASSDESQHDSRPLRDRLAAIRAAEQADAEPSVAAPAVGPSSRRRVARADENDDVAPRSVTEAPAGDASMLIR